MYQYAAARKLQIKYGDAICCDISKFDYFGTNVTPRPFALDAFCLIAHIKVGRFTWQRLVCKIKQKLNAKNAKEIKAQRGLFIPNGYMEFFPLDECKARTKYVKGLFQAHRCFDDIREILKKDFALKKPLQGTLRQLKIDIMSGNSVCIHWRRGDYLNAQYAHLNVCNYEYYLRAVQTILQEVPDPIFYLFTNSVEDANYIAAHYPFPVERMVYINTVLAEEEHTDIDDFDLMRSCKHFVMSNSTFSWWAQYLCENENKIVYAPSVWIKNDEDTSELYEKEWRLISVE